MLVYHQVFSPSSTLVYQWNKKGKGDPPPIFSVQVGVSAGMSGSWLGLPGGSPGCPVYTGPNAGRNWGATENPPVAGPVCRMAHRTARSITDQKLGATGPQQNQPGANPVKTPVGTGLPGEESGLTGPCAGLSGGASGTPASSTKC